MCVPTYNRATYLERLLQGIASEIGANKLEDQVEVVICDNASNDGSEEMLNKFSLAYSWLRVTRNRTNLGIEGNIIQSMLVATGKYTWLLSDHQITLKGVLVEVLAVVRKCSPAVVVMCIEQWSMPLPRASVCETFAKLSRAEMGAVFFFMGNISVNLYRTELALRSIQTAYCISGRHYPHLALLSILAKDDIILQLAAASRFPDPDPNKVMVRHYDTYVASFIDHIVAVKLVLRKSDLRWSLRGFQTCDYFNAMAIETIRILSSRRGFIISTEARFIRAAWVNAPVYIFSPCSVLALIGFMGYLLPLVLRRWICIRLLSIFAPKSVLLSQLTVRN